MLSDYGKTNPIKANLKTEDRGQITVLLDYQVIRESGCWTPGYQNIRD